MVHRRTVLRDALLSAHRFRFSILPSSWQHQPMTWCGAMFIRNFEPWPRKFFRR